MYLMKTVKVKSVLVTLGFTITRIFRIRLMKASCYRRLTKYTNHISNTDYVDLVIVCHFSNIQSGTVKDHNRLTPKLSTKHPITLPQL
jgi:hypothetical protein